MILAIGIIVCIVACYLWVKFVFAIFRLINKKPIQKPINPYIEAQKTIMENDKNYEDYLKWMDEKGSGVPLNKLMTEEEYKAERQYKKLI